MNVVKCIYIVSPIFKQLVPSTVFAKKRLRAEIDLYFLNNLIWFEIW